MAQPMTTAVGNTGGTPDALSPAVIEILLSSLAALAAAGEVEKACRLAGRACVALRHEEPKAARKFDVLLHRLTPKLVW